MSRRMWTAIGAGAGAVAGVAYAGAVRWSARTRELCSALHGQRAAGAPRRFDPAAIDALPPPVTRYLRTVLTPGQAYVRTVRIRHTGTFNTSGDTDAWKRFTSEQYVVIDPPGFVWNARVAMFPGLPIRAHDAYVGGEGILDAAVFGLFPVARMRGDKDVNEGELMRFLAEAAWYPTALLPSPALSWSPVDASSARATLCDGGTSATLTFVFDSDGLITTVRADARGRTSGGVIVPTPWEGRWRDYEPRNGMLVPTGGEVAWIQPQGPQPYWRGQVASLDYEFYPH